MVASSAMTQRRPLGVWWSWCAAVLALLLAAVAVDWDLDALTDPVERSRAVGRVGSWLAALLTPDLSGPFLAQAWRLTLETLAVALLGSALGLVAALLLALGSSRAVAVGSQPAWWRHLLCAGCRLLQDILRAVPDFVWAVMLVAVVGLGPTAGMLAIALSMTGILAKVYSELWDNLNPRQYQMLSQSGGGRLVTFAYGIRPLTGRSMLSFTLMRVECAVRNAAVIGVVGGGGLGAEILYQIQFGAWDQVSTLLGFTLLLTLAVDLGSNLLRHQLRQEADRAGQRSSGSSILRGYVAVAAALSAVLVAVWYLGWGQRGADGVVRNHLQPLADLLRGEHWSQLQLFARLLQPDLQWATLQQALVAAAVPLAMATVATMASFALAAIIGYAYSASFQLNPERFAGGRTTFLGHTLRWLRLVAARIGALVLRGVPEVMWVLLLIAFLGPGLLAGTLALTLHSTGLLLRVFAEAVDNLPVRKLERGGQGAPPLHAYALVAAPTVWREWLTYGFFQFEANVRMAVVLGLVGAGGLGFQFAHHFEWFRFEQAGTYLLVIIGLSVIIDRSGRWLKLSRTV